ncbi:unnamed protein product [Hydatigera taeniaeformis]|uniref:Tafazzin family protein n=1 Tax=Hydatigena taeniaeformis TaxID=6205 RepID=A0A158RDG2_HYDTA|nr:unnamed protein product [Hydatigera taeniaeformis]
MGVSRIPIDLAYRLYCNAYKRSICQRIFHVIPIVMAASLAKLAFLRHRFKMVNAGTLLDIVKNRPAYKPLITVSNHYSCLDDIILFGQVLPYEVLFDADRLRWTLAAVDICFVNSLYSAFFASGKGIPVWRRVRDPETGDILLPGLGVCQPSMEFCLELLNAGQWIHSFSQGRVILPHERNNETSIRLRWGIGRLLAEASVDPIVLPIWHCGIDEMSPCEEPYVRRTLTRLFGPPLSVTVLVGSPFEVGYLARKSGRTGASLYTCLTASVQHALYQLKPTAEAEHAKHKASLELSY